jgi:hypothetical protein
MCMEAIVVGIHWHIIVSRIRARLHNLLWQYEWRFFFFSLELVLCNYTHICFFVSKFSMMVVSESVNKLIAIDQKRSLIEKFIAFCRNSFLSLSSLHYVFFINHHASFQSRRTE